jgi:hypothetical protein
MEPRARVELATCRLRIGCSTTELPRLINHLRVLVTISVIHSVAISHPSIFEMASRASSSGGST